MYRPLFSSVATALLVSLIANGFAEESGDFHLSETILTIKQVDYEGAIYYTDGDPYPHLNSSKIQADVVVDKEHQAIIMENAYIKLTLLPEMGRVYSLVYKPTGNEVFWRNDIVTAGGGQHNDCGWWLWIGGAEYTLPGDEHGTTWAETWEYRILEDSETRKAVRMSVLEQGTGLEEDIDISVYPGRSYYEAHIRISNPTEEVVQYAHWINPQWTPGGHNELTDSTEFIIPTDRILIPAGFQSNLGPSPQEWATSRLRFISGWDRGWGDLMADGLKEGFYSAYSHDEEEGVVRIFDKQINIGVDIWTYGYHPTNIPMGSGAPNKGYAEMWGGTSKLYPDERHPIAPGEVVEWTEWMYPYQDTGGLSYANEDVALNFVKDIEKGTATLGLCPSARFDGVQCTVASGDVLLFEGTVDLAPDQPFWRTIVDPTQHSGAKVTLTYRGEILGEYLVVYAGIHIDGAPVADQWVRLDVTVVWDPSRSPQPMSLDLSPLGISSELPLLHAGGGRYTGSTSLTLPERGRYSLAVILGGIEDERTQLALVPLDVYPGGDLSIYADGPGDGWTVTTRKGEPDLKSSTFTHSGRFSHAISLPTNSMVTYTFDDPDGIDLFGYTHLEFYINGGESFQQGSPIIIGSAEVIWPTKLSDLGAEVQSNTWTLVSIPISSEEPMKSIYFTGGAKETFYIDDMKLVATTAPGPTAVTESEGNTLPSGYALSQNVPNPFNAHTTVCYAIPEAGEVQLAIYTTSGQRVRMLVNDYQQAGSYSVVWDGKDERGWNVASGVYVYRFQGTDVVQAKRMVLVR